MPTQHPGAQRVEGAHRHLPAGLADEPQDPLPHLVGGLVGERHREDLPRTNTLDTHQVRDAMCQHPGLAGTGARQDEQRTLCRGDGSCLLWIQPADDALRERRRPEQVVGWCHHLPRWSLSTDAGDGREPGGLLRVRLCGVRRCRRPLAPPPRAGAWVGLLLERLVGIRVRQRLRRRQQLGPVERFLVMVGHRPMLARFPYRARPLGRHTSDRSQRAGTFAARGMLVIYQQEYP